MQASGFRLDVRVPDVMGIVSFANRDLGRLEVLRQRESLQSGGLFLKLIINFACEVRYPRLGSFEAPWLNPEGRVVEA